MEVRLERSIEWENRPKPKVDYAEPKDITDANRIIEKSKLMFDLIGLALQNRQHPGSHPFPEHLFRSSSCARSLR